MIATLLAMQAMTSSAPFSSLVRVLFEPAFSATNEQVTELETVDAGHLWNEAIVSWNVAGSQRAFLKVEAQAVYPDRSSKWYVIANWFGDLSLGSRTSIPKQNDMDGDILTDTLHLNQLCEKLRLRITQRQVAPGEIPKLRLLTVSFSNTQASEGIAGKVGKGRSITLEVPKRSQGPYERGKLKYDPNQVSENFETWFKGVKQAQYCSPTALSMVLDYWSGKLSQPSLNVDVPEVVAGVFDEKYPGTGNWAFNVAYAGSFPGTQSYVTRLKSVADLEKLVNAGVPVICSLAYNLLLGNGKPRGGDGHLVVLVGFTKNGDPIFNDPGRSDDVRQTYKRENFWKAWNDSHRTVYLIYPEGKSLPKLSESSVLTN